MSCIRCALLRGATILVLLCAGGIGASSAGDHSQQPPLVIAQTSPPPEAQETKSEPLSEQDPVAAAEQAVDDARAALRNAMATGGDVRAARRDLQAALRHLNKIKAADKTEAEADEDDAEKTAAAPPSEAPSGQTSSASTPEVAVAPQEPSEAVPTLPAAPAAAPTQPPQMPAAPAESESQAAATDTPADAAPTAATPSADETPTQPQPLPPPTQGRQLALPTPPASPSLPPPSAVPTLPSTGEAPDVGDEMPAAVVPTPEQATTETPVAEAPAQVQSETEKDAESPGFFRRLFGAGERQPQDSDEQSTAAADQDSTETEKTADKTDESSASDESAGEPSLPIFRKLPPLQGPKVVNTPPDGAEVVEETDEKRVIVKKGGRMTIIHDDNDRFRRKGEDVKVEKGKGGTTITTVTRGNGNQVVTVRDRSGDILQRYRKRTNGEIEMLIGERYRDGRPRRAVDAPPPVDRNRSYDFARRLPPLVVPIPRNQYVLGSHGTSRSRIQQALAAPPIEAIERPYSLDEIRRSARLRAKLRRIDIDTVNFEFGAATIAEDQVPNLQAIGNAIAAILADDPSQVFLIEGHTDAVGSDRSNLALSDRRAEAIAQVLTFYFNIPPENLITQGYGEQHLKVLTAGPERRNRRGTVRNITALLVGQR